MNKNAEIQLIGIVGILLFLGTLYTLNYTLPKENEVILTSQGFNILELNLHAGEYVLIKNNDLVLRSVVVNGEQLSEIPAGQLIKFRLINAGIVSVEIKDRLSKNSILTITVQ